MPKADLAQLKEQADTLTANYSRLVKDRLEEVASGLESLARLAREAASGDDMVVGADRLLRHVFWTLSALRLPEIATIAAILRTCQGQKALLERLEASSQAGEEANP